MGNKNSRDNNGKITLRQFVVNIWVRHIQPSAAERLQRQREMWNVGDFLKSPLPLDSASSTTPEFMPWLLESVDTAAAHFYDNLAQNSCKATRDRQIFVASAATGMGKTHLAYAVGMSVPVVFIRVECTPGKYSAPWERLSTTLETFDNLLTQSPIGHSSKEAHSDKLIEIAKCAYSYLELLVGCYLSVALKAVSEATALGMNPRNVRELLLRFQRNRMCDLFVLNEFETQIKKCKQVGGSIALNKEKVANFLNLVTRESFLAACDEGRFVGPLIVFDEAHALLSRHKTLFLHQEEYVLGRQGSSIAIEQRGLLNATSCVMYQFLAKKFEIYLTGTSLSLLRVENSKSNVSLVRGGKQVIDLKPYLFTTESMKKILTKFWKFDGNLFRRKSVRDKLNKFVGRPSYFVHSVLSVIYMKLNSEPDGLLSVVDSVEKLNVDSFEQFLLNCADGLKTRIVVPKVNHLFKDDESVSTANSASLGVKAVIPKLIEALIFSDGELRLSSPVVDYAICGGIIPISAFDEDKIVNLISFEPLTCEAIQEYLLKTVDSKFGEVFNLLMSAVVEGKGKRMEFAFALFILLRSIQYKQKNERNIPLYDLLEPFIPDYARNSIESYVDCLDGWECDLQQIRQIRGNELCFSEFIIDDEDDEETKAPERTGRVFVCTSKILMGMSNSMGLDITFLATKGDTQRLIAVQCKNWDHGGSISRSLLTLSSGTQYLTNVARKCLLLGGGEPTDGWRSHGHDAYLAFFRRYEVVAPFLFSGWVRIALIAKIPPDDSLRSIDTINKEANNRLSVVQAEAKSEEDHYLDVSPFFIATFNTARMPQLIPVSSFEDYTSAGDNIGYPENLNAFEFVSMSDVLRRLESKS